MNQTNHNTNETTTKEDWVKANKGRNPSSQHYEGNGYKMPDKKHAGRN